MAMAVSAVLDHAFGELHLNRVEIRVAPDNRRSRALPERLGFREEGVLRQAERHGEHYGDLTVYSMLAHEWEATKP
jgi:ribosomal-protein-serine acetyltransferase